VPGGELIDQFLFCIEAVRIVLGGEILQRRRGVRRSGGRRRRAERGWPDREQPGGREVLPLACRRDERCDRSAMRRGGLASIAAELKVLVRQLGEIQSFQIAAEESEMLVGGSESGGADRGPSHVST